MCCKVNVNVRSGKMYIVYRYRGGNKKKKKKGKKEKKMQCTHGRKVMYFKLSLVFYSCFDVTFQPLHII